jgi:carbamate kinase
MSIMRNDGPLVVAIGGNALISDEQHASIPDQYEAVRRLAPTLAALAAGGRPLVVTHGNGPQVGFILRRSELAATELATVPLDYAVGDTQGAIAHMFLVALRNAFADAGVARPVVALVTETLVDEDDRAFRAPAKPIGAAFDETLARAHAATFGWTVAPDPPRGWRRVVASPDPVEILELDQIRTLLATGAVVVACGGGGIPVVRDPRGALRGVEAVVDKDLVSALLADGIDAAALVITTSVARVAQHYGTPAQRWLDELTTAEAAALVAAGEFPPGTMQPKVEALVRYVDGGPDRTGIITSLEHVADALDGHAGTRVVRTSGR